MPVCNVCGTNYSFWKKACPNCTKAKEAFPATPQNAQVQDMHLPQDPGNSYEQGMQLFQQEKYTEALPHLEQAVQQYSQSFTVWSLYSRTLDKIGRFQDALDAAKKALALNPTYAHAWQSKGYALDSLKRPTEAISALDMCLQYDPGNIRVRHVRGRIYFSVQEYKRALAEYDACLKVEPDNAEYLTSKGVVLMSLKRFLDAAAVCDRRIALDPLSVPAWRSKAMCLHMYGDSKSAEALQTIEHTLAIDPNDSQSLTIKGMILGDMTMFSQARELLTRAIALDPTNELAAELLTEYNKHG